MKYYYRGVLVFSLCLLVYMLVPGPRSVYEFPAIPESNKSKLDGDTWQVPNVVAFFSDRYRDFATDYYQQSYRNKTSLPFEPIRLNYPPEFAYTAIKVETQSTYLEEYVYPLRDSLYVNGMEPFYENGDPKFNGSFPFYTPEGYYPTKVTLRFYPSSWYIRVLVWGGIVVSFLGLGFVGKRIFRYA